MNLSFTIPYPFIEFMCHAVAAVLYMSSGGMIYAPRYNTEAWSGLFILILAIILTTIGANL